MSSRKVLAPVAMERCRLGGGTDEEIRRAVTHEVARDGRKLKPPMAFAAYAGMSAQDQDAIVAFLRTLAPRE